MINLLNNWQEQGLISSCGQVIAVLPILFVSSYSYIIKLEQIHMQLLLNCRFFVVCDLKSGQMTI